MTIAKTVLAVANLEHPLAAAIMDRSHPITHAFVDRAISLSQFTWHGRRPIPAVDKNGNKRNHDLDLLSVMVELARRRAHVRLPGYANLLPWQITAGEQHVGTDRFGMISRLISHREHLSFSVRIKDQSVVKHADGSVGALRTYAMVGYDGSWNPGWRGVKWRFSEDEAEFFTKRRLLQDGELNFRYYVHPHRRQSYGSAAYLVLKLLWQRLEDEVAFYTSELKRLRGSGVTEPKDLRETAPVTVAQGESRNVFVPRFVMKLTGLEFRGAYASVSTDADGYRTAYLRRKEIVEDLQPLTQFVVRADEAAFYLYGMSSGFTPWWINGPKWQKEPWSQWTTLSITDSLSLSYFRDEVPKAVAAQPQVA